MGGFPLTILIKGRLRPRFLHRKNRQAPKREAPQSGASLFGAPSGIRKPPKYLIFLCI
nr:MAG TPA: hypothetical protein [Caudoviricetes sp.]